MCVLSLCVCCAVSLLLHCCVCAVCSLCVCLAVLLRVSLLLCCVCSLSLCVSLAVLLCVLCATLARLCYCACVVYSLRRVSVAHCEEVLFCGHCSAGVLGVNEGTVSSG